ncbi:putative toxin-antitoxin system toxin component, PIN family [Mucilaginibacter sp.]|uniref:putative toxin-antitoxin system toxin component, PIN family n=1 Tax=Mucilaginibacter sp. TaxID=1882438 RepID=UPI002635F4DA|nr:putative toxin-antitoxin system toxin component, PIN family [Mucilaginibacter sp.]MDB4920968.1 putative toxin-antitoxin system toxin component, family [Mucilaginibacter sp.]
MKVVLDSNVLLVALGRKSRYKANWEAFADGKYQMIISDEIVYEYNEILNQHSALGVAEAVIEVFIESPDIIFQQIYYKWDAIKKDPDENKFFDIAVAANADYLVTNDAHFNAAKKLAFPSVKIISVEQFLSVIQIL